MFRPQYIAHLNIENIAATTPYILVDLSDTTNFKHTKTTEIQVLGIFASFETAATGIFDVYFGTVVENDATDGTAVFFDGVHLESQNNPTANTGQLNIAHDYTLGGLLPTGIPLTISSGAMTRVTSLHTDANVRWQNDVNTVSSGLATAKIGVGDLVMLVEEVTDGGTIDASITVIYTTA